MSFVQNLSATAALAKHWAKPEIAHAPTPAELLDIAEQLAFAAEAIRDLEAP